MDKAIKVMIMTKILLWSPTIQPHRPARPKYPAQDCRHPTLRKAAYRQNEFPYRFLSQKLLISVTTTLQHIFSSAPPFIPHSLHAMGWFFESVIFCWKVPRGLIVKNSRKYLKALLIDYFSNHHSKEFLCSFLLKNGITKK